MNIEDTEDIIKSEISNISSIYPGEFENTTKSDELPSFILNLKPSDSIRCENPFNLTIKYIYTKKYPFSPYFYIKIVQILQLKIILVLMICKLKDIIVN